MPMLAAMFVNLFKGLFSMFAFMFGARFAMGASAVTAFGLLTTALVVALSAIVQGIVVSFPSFSGVELAAYAACPSNLPYCISAVVAAEVNVALYRWNARNLGMLAGA